MQSTLLGGFGIDLFSVFDDDQDGDLDLIDVAVFMNTYDPAPKRVQSDARPVAAACCFTLNNQRSAGECLSGPDVLHSVESCDNQGICSIGFSALIEPGDYLYKMCAPAPSIPKDNSSAACAFWSHVPEPIAFSCVASYDPGITPFVTFDADGDGDFDLSDLAAVLVEPAD